jgi:glycosyltransferase involved in cell wall biosynthesis
LQFVSTGASAVLVCAHDARQLYIPEGTYTSRHPLLDRTAARSTDDRHVPLLKSFAKSPLWSEYEPDTELVDGLPVKRISPLALSMPFGGTLVFVGVYFRVGHWVRLARPRRVVVIYNTDQPDRLAKNLRRISHCGRAPRGGRDVAGARRAHRREGPVPREPHRRLSVPRVRRPEREGFTIGRLSRDAPTKHHDEDVEVYRRLSALGCRGASWEHVPGRPPRGTPNVELLLRVPNRPRCSCDRSTASSIAHNERWFEAFGRVVFEAMASGLPVGVLRTWRLCRVLSSGNDSLVFESSADAVREILRLREDPALRSRLGPRRARERLPTVGAGLGARTLQYFAPDAPARRLRLITSEGRPHFQAGE